MSVSVQEIIDQTNDYLRNYTTGSIDLGNRLRAVNRAMEFVKRRMMLPSDERTFDFWYTQDQNFYDIPLTYSEPIDLIYQDKQLNIPQSQWLYRPYPQVLELTGNQPYRRLFGTTYMNQKLQLLMYGPQINQGQILETFDNPIQDGWVGQADATDLVADPNQKVQGSASLQFKIDVSVSGLNRASLFLDFGNEPQNYTVYHSQHAIFKMFVYFASTDFTGISFNFGTDLSNYYKITTDQLDDSTPFDLNNWGKIAWSFDDAVQVGSPLDTNITFWRIDFDYDPSMTDVLNMRVDDLFVTIPDRMQLIYASSVKGTNAAGDTELVNFTNASDLAGFGDFAPDMINLIALRAALYLNPQLKQDPTWYGLYKSEFEETIKIFGRIYPRKRIVNYGKTELIRGQFFTI